MHRLARLSLVSLLPLLLFACGNPAKEAEEAAKNSSNSSAKISYRFSQNGCDTEKQEFNASSREESVKQMCDALQDDQRNHGCAEALRREYFAKSCPGTFQPRYGETFEPIELPAEDR